MSSSICRKRFLNSNNKLAKISPVALIVTAVSLGALLPPLVVWAAPVPQMVTGKDAANLSLLEKRVENGIATPDVVEALGRLVERDPRNGRARFVFGRVLYLAGYASLAEEQFKKADELDPTQPGALLELFQSKLDANDVVGAYKLLGYMAYRFPDDPAVLYMQGLFAFSRGDTATAEARLQQALQSPRASTGVKSMIAALRINQRNYAEAVRLADADLAKNPEHFYANLMKGQALFLSGRSAQALPFLKKAYSLRPVHPGLAELLSRAYQQKGFYADALEPALFEMAVTTKQDRLEKVKVRIAYLLRFLNAHQTANVAAMARRRLGDRAEAPRLYFALGDVLDRLGRRREAIAQYRKGLAEDPKMGRGWYRLARDFENIGDINMAMRSYMKALELTPEDTQIALSATRFRNRLVNRKHDVAWQLKQLLRNRKQGTVSSA